MKAVLAIDQGTTGSTAIVLDEHGAELGRGYAEFTQHYPQPGWVEHDATELWDTTLRVAREAITASGGRVGEGAGGGSGQAPEIVALGITNQRETAVAWDRESGRPLHRAIVWQDRRTAARCRELKPREDWLRERTGLVADPYFTATKLEWLLEHAPEVRAAAEGGRLAVGTVDAWLIWKLTGGAVHATDPTNASRTLLYGLRERAWDEELLELFGVPAAALPEVRPSSGDFGHTAPDLFGAPLLIGGVAGDQQAALFGQGCVRAGMAKNTYGTGAFLLLHTGDEPVPSKHGLLTTVACDPTGGPAYALEGAIFIAGAAVQWLRDGLEILGTAAETEVLAGSLESNDGVYFVPAFVGLGGPHWEPEARGTIVGLTRGNTRAHLARAALEAMAYSTLDVLEAMEADSGVAARELAIDGGASANDWLARFQADIVNLPVRRPQMVETTALGAAGLAGIAAGVWQDADAFLHARPEPDRFEPGPRAGDRAALIAGWRRAVQAALAWARAAHAE
ncbi:MAG: glycerol kinase GlpK [Gemmatimonadota bacterium]